MAVSGSVAGSPRYDVVDLGTLGGASSVALAINGASVVVGTSELPGDQRTHAFVYRAGSMLDLGTLPGLENSAATAVNDAGVVAGEAWARGPAGERTSTRAFSSRRGRLVALPGRARRQMQTASGVAGTGTVVGTAAGAAEDGDPVAVGVGSTGFSTLVPGPVVLGGTNRAGDLVGTRMESPAVSRAFLRHGGSLRVVPALGHGGSSVGAAVNDRGDVVGWSTTGPGGAARAFLSTRGQTFDLGLPPGTESEARALNDRGEVVGDFWDAAAGERHAFLWEHDTAIDLNRLVSPGSGWVLEQATGINDAGSIVGVGTHAGRTHAFLLVPLGKAGALERAASPSTTSALRPHPRRAAGDAPIGLVPSRPAGAAATDPSIDIVSENPKVYTQAVDADGYAYGDAVGGSTTDLLRSRDEGATWSLVHRFPAGSSLYHMAAISSGTVFAALGYQGSETLWRSPDHGVTWTRVLTLPTAPVFYRTLTPHSIADGDGYVWLGTYNNGPSASTNYLYRSSDDGRTWTIASTSSTHKHIHGVRFDPANGKLYVLFGDSSGDGIWQSSDDGTTLTPLCTSYDCVTVDLAFDPSGSFGIFGQDHYKSKRSIVRIDLASGVLTTLAPLPYTSYSALRLGGTYLIGTTRESGEATADPDLHVFASSNGDRFVDAYRKPVAYAAGIESLRVQFAFPNGDFPIQIGGYGTIIGRLAPLASAPGNTAPPTISGVAAKGEVLSAGTGRWTGSPTSYAYQWRRCDSTKRCADVAGATSRTYEVVASDVGSTLRVVVTASNSLGSASATSEPASLGGTRPRALGPPTVAGTAAPGKTLTAKPPRFTAKPTRIAYRWQLCTSRGCTAIGGPKPTLRVVRSYVGRSIRVVVTATVRGVDVTSISKKIPVKRR